MTGVRVPVETLEVAPILRSAIGALSTFDDVALEALLAQAEAASARMHTAQIADAREAVALQQSFHELLSTTSRSLGTLERLRSRKEDAWVR